MHRGCLLGAVLGAYHGERGIPEQLKEGLHDSAALRKEIEAFKAVVARSARA